MIDNWYGQMNDVKYLVVVFAVGMTCLCGCRYWDIDWGNPERFRRLLLSAYLAFKYDGFSFFAVKMKGVI